MRFPNGGSIKFQRERLVKLTHDKDFEHGSVVSLTLLEPQSRFRDTRLKLYPKRDRGPKRVKLYFYQSAGGHTYKKRNCVPAMFVALGYLTRGKAVVYIISIACSAPRPPSPSV